MHRAPSTVALVAVVGLVTGAAAVGAAQTGRPLLVVVLWPLQVLLAGCWLRGLGAPRPGIGAALAAASALAADLVVCRDIGTGAHARSAGVGGLAGIAGVALLATIVLQLADRRRERVTDVLTAQISAILLAVAPACLIALRGARSGREGAVAGVLALACGGVLGRLAQGLLPEGVAGRDRVMIVALSWATGGAASGAGYLGGHGAVIGVASGAAGGLAALLAAACSQAWAGAGDPPAAGNPQPAGPGRPGWTDRGRSALTSAPLLGALLPVSAAAPAAYVLGRVLLG